jgi:hypothetical protein
MRIERGHHAGDGLGQQLLVFDRFDVVGFDQAEHIGQLAQLFQRQRRVHRLLRHRRELQRDGNASHHTQSDQTGIL